jgi:hypothetical protein
VWGYDLPLHLVPLLIPKNGFQSEATVQASNLVSSFFEL